MKVLIIGGTGQISTALTHLLASEGYTVTIFNRAQRSVPLPASVEIVVGDRNDRDEFRRLLGGSEYDVVFDFICWGPADAASDLETFRNHCRQIFYISTAWVYGPASVFPT